MIVGDFDVLQDLILRSYDGPPHAKVVKVIQIVLDHEQDFIAFTMLR